ncbi:MAG: RagB/SusD family nutrient uptake outer membrane protein [Rhodospirillaceae bacterium]|uniref:RagB/SusD family nutrient uptake outer membrane protein n=1 Tax=Roseivirga pacifica TaxID=1267423 RepID=UPI000C455FC5|nr:RagB/SusD family nutrient uptake outer membrane protein [Roseivirga pacifica]MBH98218.1 RagB/SusD family nutrient uptake outer membrane protein [Rhodospirillaceae bacterium]
MKKLLAILLVGSIASFTACEDMEFLNPKPEDRITAEVALSDLDGAAAHIAKAFERTHFFGNYGQTMMLNPDALADNVDLLNNTGRYVGQLVNQVRNHTNIYSSYYQMINDVQIALSAVEDFRDDDPARAAILEGQAKFVRGLAYFDLARVYGYEPGQEVGGFNLAVPIQPEAVLGTSNISELERATNVEVYTMVKADLLDAVNLLPAESAEGNFPYLPTSTSAKALLARVYLYEGSYAQAATTAEQVLAETSATLTDVTNHVASWETVQHPEAIFSLNINQVDWSSVDGVNNSLASMTNTDDPSRGLNSSQGVLRASTTLLDELDAEPNDIRRDLWVNPTGADNWEARKWVGEQGNFLEHIPIIRVAEMVLTAAEGHARSGNATGARTQLNVLRNARGTGDFGGTDAQLADEILRQRRMELVLEGHRFHDLKRLGMDIPKAPAQGGVPVQYTDFRVLSNIPDGAISNNSLLEQNPGY